MQVIAHECQENLHFFAYATCVAEKLCQECEKSAETFYGDYFFRISLCLQSQMSFSSSASNITEL